MPSYPNKKQKTIIYDQAPSGYINIEKWEPPFAVVKGGFGFMGIVAEDASKEGKLQCHSCGKWYEQLPPHYTFKHGMTGVQYREKYGLLSSTALKSKRLRLIQSKIIIQLQKDGKMNTGNNKNQNGKSYGFKKNNKESGNRKGKPKAMEAQNKYGKCDLQIMTKIIQLGKKLGKTPTLIDIKNEYGGGIISIMHLRYGSYVKYCREYLKMTPGFSNANPRTKKQWREHLLSMGKEMLNKNKSLENASGFLPANENRYIYKYFKNWEDYKKQLVFYCLTNR